MSPNAAVVDLQAAAGERSKYVTGSHYLDTELVGQILSGARTWAARATRHQADRASFI